MITINQTTGAAKIIINAIEPEFLPAIRASLRTGIKRIAESEDYNPKEDGPAIFFLTTLLEQVEMSREKEIQFYKSQQAPATDKIKV